MSFPNVYMHRKVAEGAAKGCEVCYKPSTSVLITPENKDFFYICASHLKERGFCTPIIDKVAEEAKKKKQEEEKERLMKEEVDRVKKEYEEKKKKKEDDKKKDDKDKDKEEKEKEKGKEKDEKTEKSDEDGKSGDSKTEDTQNEAPRVFALQKFVYQQRLDKKRQIDLARKTRERMANPDFFPSVPKSLP